MITPPNFLCSFRPLAWSLQGKIAVQNFGLNPFADASCRREPDFEANFPSITALCRKEHFAPKIRVGSIIIYITKRGTYFNSRTSHWRLVAILEVIKSFQNHKDAADWYMKNNEIVPSNCMVYGNKPIDLEKTDKFHPELNRWDAIYRLRAKNCGVFHVCNKNTFCELKHPPAITEAMMEKIFGKIPETFAPPEITEEQVKEFVQISKREEMIP